MTITVDNEERELLLNVVDRLASGARDLRYTIPVIEQLEWTRSEKENLGIIKPGGGAFFAEKSHTHEFEFDEETSAFLRDKVRDMYKEILSKKDSQITSQRNLSRIFNVLGLDLMKLLNEVEEEREAAEAEESEAKKPKKVKNPQKA